MNQIFNIKYSFKSNLGLSKEEIIDFFHNNNKIINYIKAGHPDLALNVIEYLDESDTTCEIKDIIEDNQCY